MRHAISLLSAAALFGALGCKPPPKDQLVDHFKRAVQHHFDEQNREALDRKDKLRGDLDRALKNPHMDPATGTVYSTFVFDPEGFVVENYKCQACGTLLLLAAPASQYLCPSCGHSPYRSHTDLGGKEKLKSLPSPCPKCANPGDGRVKPPTEEQVGKDALKLADGAVLKEMFQLTDDNPEKPLKAKVRYVRKLWVFDPRGSIKLSQAAQTKAAVDMTWLPSEAAYDPTSTDPMARYSRPGFHRLDGTYVGEITFQFRGGSLEELSRATEVAVRPWKDLTTVGK